MFTKSLRAIFPTEKGYAFRFLEKAGQKLWIVTAETLRINPERSELKRFLSTFFKKVAVSKGGAFGGIFKGKALEQGFEDRIPDTSGAKTFVCHRLG